MTRDFVTQLAPFQERCAKAIYDHANSKYGNDGWHKVSYDFRYEDFSDEGIGCGVALLATGERRMDFSAPIESIQILFNNIPKLRREFRDEAFFGIIFIVTSNGGVEIRYDYDPKCAFHIVQDRDAGKPF